MTKVICVVGATGNQGGSVAYRFLKDTNYRVRCLTRNPTSEAAQRLKAEGAEVVAADLDDVESLKSAFRSANVIFSVTNYWEPFFRPDCRQKALEAAVSCRKYAYDVEFQQGMNIADAAAATVNTLEENGFIASTLSHAMKSSHGAFKELYHFDAKADIFPDYVQERHPDLAAKMSCLQTGYFTSSYRLAPGAYFRKLDEGGFQMNFPTHPDAPVPHLDVNADVGNYVYAINQLSPGKNYLAEGTTCSWSEYMKLWSSITNIPGSYQQITLEKLVKGSPDPEFGAEIGDMFACSSDPGYDGGDASLLKAADIRQLGVECPTTSLEEWMKKEDWSLVIKQ